MSIRSAKISTALLLLLAMLVGILAGCGNVSAPEEPTSAATETSAVPETQSTETETEPARTVEIIKDGKSAYTLMRSDTRCSKALTDSIVQFNKNLKEILGSSLPIKVDWVQNAEDIPTDTLEILIGQTNRAETAALMAKLQKSQFLIGVLNSRLVILGYNDNLTRAALTYFLQTYLTGKDLTLEEGFLDIQEIDQPYRVVKLAREVNYPSGYNTCDITRLVVSLQGKLNERAPETGMLVYIMNDSSDTYWLDYMMQEGNMLFNSDVEEIPNFATFWEFAKPYVQELGLIAWDPAVPSTSNVAATICGLDGYIPVCFDESENSLYSFLIREGCEVKQSLVGLFEGAAKGKKIADTSLSSSGSSKCDAYLWALDKYMDRCSKEMTAYVLDGASCLPDNYICQTGGLSPESSQIFNHDYLLMNKCFFWDLSVVSDEVPCDDPTQPMGTDYKTACEILLTLYERAGGNMVQCIGFPMWWMKYTVFHNMGKTGEVALEWKFAELITTYNCVMEADAANPCWLCNGSVYTQYKLKQETFTNNTVSNSEPLRFDKKVRYFTIYLGDYDCSAWLKYHMPTIWNDKTRGTLPLMWGFNPNLSRRVPMVFEYIYKTLTPNDYIVTGDSGAGYANPSGLLEARLRGDRPSAREAWMAYNKPYNKKFDLDICGFLLNGSNPITNEVLDMYADMFPGGAFTNQNVLINYDGFYLKGLQMDVYDGTRIEDIYNTMKSRSDNFNAFRTICRSPSFISNLVNSIISYGNSQKDGYTYVYVDPYQFFELLQESGQGQFIRP